MSKKRHLSFLVASALLIAIPLVGSAGATTVEVCDRAQIEVGELSEKKNKGRLKNVGKREERLLKPIEDLDKLVNATSSDDLGGFIDIPLKKTAAGQKWR